MTGNSIVFQNLEERRSEVERHKENASRLAEVGAHFKSTGLGSIEFPTRVDFGLTFFEKPVASHCAEIDVDDLEEMLDTDYNKNLTGPLPIVTGYVTNWDVDHKGYYVGAFCGARIWFPTTDLVDPTINVVITHHFRFSAIGMKNVLANPVQ